MSGTMQKLRVRWHMEVLLFDGQAAISQLLPIDAKAFDASRGKPTTLILYRHADAHYYISLFEPATWYYYRARKNYIDYVRDGRDYSAANARISRKDISLSGKTPHDSRTRVKCYRHCYSTARREPMMHMGRFTLT